MFGKITNRFLSFCKFVQSWSGLISVLGNHLRPNLLSIYINKHITLKVRMLALLGVNNGGIQ